MRSYPEDSAQAAARLLALAIIVDGGASPAEIGATARAHILKLVPLDEQQFADVLHDLCDDLQATTFHGVVQIQADTIDHLLGEITRTDLRRNLWQGIWQIADADGWLADAEAVLLSRAALVWGAGNGFGGPERSGRYGREQPPRR